MEVMCHLKKRIMNLSDYTVEGLNEVEDIVDAYFDFSSNHDDEIDPWNE
jgi:hypothetical protein